jgi:hypothetical protein
MKSKISLLKITALSLSILLLGPVPATHSLPSTFERELKNAKKTEIGKKTVLAVEQCKSTSKGGYSTKCTLRKFEVVVNSFTFREMRNSYDYDNHIYDIDVTLKNYSNLETGLDVGALLRCSNSQSGSSFYSDGIDPQFVLGRSQLSGVITASFPMPTASCQNPTLWLELWTSGIDAQDKKQIKNAKKRKLVRAAYIPLNNSQLNL